MDIILMKSLYESLLDDDDKIKQDLKQNAFYVYFAECFVQVFGKIDRKKDTQFPGRLGIITVGKLGQNSSNKWYWDNWRVNDFISKLKEMRKLLRKRYPKADFHIEEHHMVHVVDNMWMCKYLIDVYRDKDEDAVLNWSVDVIKDDSYILQILIHSATMHALQNRELLKIIDDNI